MRTVKTLLDEAIKIRNQLVALRFATGEAFMNEHDAELSKVYRTVSLELDNLDISSYYKIIKLLEEAANKENMQ